MGKILKKWWFWGIIIVLVIFIGTSNQENAEKKIIEQTEHVEVQKHSEQKEETAVYKIGDTVSVGNFEYTVLEVSDSNVLGTNPYLKKETENNYVKVKLSVKNIGNEAKYIDNRMFELSDKKGSKYSADSTLDMYANESGENFFFEEINPGITKSAYVVFETPSANSEVHYELKVNGGIVSGKSAIILLGE